MGFASRQGFRSQAAQKPIQASVNWVGAWLKQSLNQEQGNGELKRWAREMWGKRRGGRKRLSNRERERRDRWRSGHGWRNSQTTRLRQREIRGEMREKADIRENKGWMDREKQKMGGRGTGGRMKDRYIGQFRGRLHCPISLKITLALYQAGRQWVEESRSSQTFASISGWPLGLIYARCRAGVLWTNIFKIHNDSFITIQKELGFRSIELMNFWLKSGS